MSILPSVRSSGGSLPVSLPLFLLLVIPGIAAAQETGTIAGLVTDRSNLEPLAGALVSVEGTEHEVLTSENGRYRISNLDPGTVTVRVKLIGFQALTRRVDVVAGRATTADFTLATGTVTLDEIVVTATGEARRREIPNAVTSIDASSVTEEVLPTDISSLIQGRATGVQIINSSGTVGSGSKIRIRGSSSISLSNEPLFVLDGVRINSDADDQTLGVGGQTISRLSDLNPDDIENIEVIKGPSAAALYGTASANGVVRITTKQGRVGPPRWNFYVEQGVIDEIATYPLNYRGISAELDPLADGRPGSCRLNDISAGACTQTGMEVAAPLSVGATTPFERGQRQQFGVNVSGGTADVRYYVSGEYATEDGVYGLPDAVRDSIRGEGLDIPDFMDNPNSSRRASLRANLTTLLRENLTMSVSTGYVSADVRLPQNDNNVLGMLPSGLLGSSNVNNGQGGYGFFLPEEVFAIDAVQEVDRFTGSANFTWQPVEWLEARATGGLDFAARQDVVFQATGTGPDFGTRRQGDRTSDKANNYEYTLDFGATASTRVTDRISSRTSVGAQYFRSDFTEVLTTGQVLPPGAGSNQAAANQFIDENFIEAKTIGSFVEQQFGFDDRLFVTGAVRADDNSAFGQDFDVVVYPKVGASYMLVDEPSGVLDNLRLRAAYGASGQQPGSNDAIRFFGGVSLAEDGEEKAGASIAEGGAGNPDLKPERSSEIEAGVDAGLLGGRLGLELTYYRRTTEDALIERRLAPSLGQTDVRFENIGETLNHGFEGALNARVVQTDRMTWDMTLAGSTNTNEIIELGEGVEPIVFGEQRHQEGFPLGAYFQEELTFEDANNDGIITVDELTFGDTASFHGYARPRYELSLFNSFNFNRRVRISGLFDYRGGHRMLNFTEAFRCQFNICEGLNSRAASLEEQARGQSQRHPLLTQSGFIEPGWFIKLRELSFTFFPPESWVSRLGADRWSVTVTGRNLATITDYTGIDPEVQQAAGNFGSREFLTQPQTRSWTLRLQFTY
jgi:TonB-linked SusC/RagA family outer membrane protein